VDLEVTFPGGKRVEAHCCGFTMSTDKAVKEGGQGTAPTPFVLFLASLGTCAGMNLVYFFEHRGLPPQGRSS
jgi:ribosomal protein S12 methylthiotransferase accessory factor